MLRRLVSVAAPWAPAAAVPATRSPWHAAFRMRSLSTDPVEVERDRAIANVANPYADYPTALYKPVGLSCSASR